MRERILPCDGVMALTQRCSMPRSTRFTVISTEDSIDVPTPTTAALNSWAPSWRSASMFVASASTTWVSWPDHFCTSAGSRSIASTSRPCLTSCSAVEAPNRPRPTTSTGALWAGRLIDADLSANDGPLFGVVEQLAPFAQRQRGGQRDGADAACEHQRAEHVFALRRQLGAQTGAQAAGGERRDD